MTICKRCGWQITYTASGWTSSAGGSECGGKGWVPHTPSRLTKQEKVIPFYLSEAAPQPTP